MISQLSSGFEAPGFCDLKLEITVYCRSRQEGELWKRCRDAKGRGQDTLLVGWGTKMRTLMYCSPLLLYNAMLSDKIRPEDSKYGHYPEQLLSKS